jgi:hypothetical protein
VLLDLGSEVVDLELLLGGGRTAAGGDHRAQIDQPFHVPTHPEDPHERRNGCQDRPDRKHQAEGKVTQSPNPTWFMSRSHITHPATTVVMARPVITLTTFRYFTAA